MVDWDLLGYVSASQTRLRILVHLVKAASTPTRMSTELGVPLSRISTSLKELQQKGLVVCLTPESRKGKLFKASEKGVALVAALHRYTDLKGGSDEGE